jgi:hypothetical protein
VTIFNGFVVDPTALRDASSLSALTDAPSFSDVADFGNDCILGISDTVAFGDASDDTVWAIDAASYIDSFGEFSIQRVAQQQGWRRAFRSMIGRHLRPGCQVRLVSATRQLMPFIL